MYHCNLFFRNSNFYLQEIEGNWPTTPSKYLKWTKDGSDVSVFVDTLEHWLYEVNFDEYKSEKNVLVLVEPETMVDEQNKDRDYQLIHQKQVRDKFDMIFTTYPKHSRLEDKVKYYNGGLRTYIQEDCRKIHQNKSSKIVGVFSWKCQLPGHIFRKKLTSFVNLHDKEYKLNEKIFFLNPPEKEKHQALQDSMYELVIENESGPFFSEKIIDSMLSGCVPVYWSEEESDDSCLDVFDKKGIIIFRSLDEFKELFNNGYFSRDYYESVKESIENNFETAKEYISFGDVIWKAGMKELWS
jgi:hypothetical protein